MYLPVVNFLALAASSNLQATTTSSAPPPGETRNPGFKWVRNVWSDLYLQGDPPRSASQAVLGAPHSGGQFIIAGGGLIQLTSKAPSYTITYFDRSTGAMTFEEGIVHPSSAGTFSWGDVLDSEQTLGSEYPELPIPPEKVLNWRDTANDNTEYTSFMLCGLDVYVALDGIAFDDSCKEITLSSLSTVDPELEFLSNEIIAMQMVL